MKKIRGMCNRGVPWFGVLVIGVLAFGFHSVGAFYEQGQVSVVGEAENAHLQRVQNWDRRIADSGSYNFYDSYGDGIPLRYGNEAVTVTAVGPGVAKPGETIVIEFMISAHPDDILLRAYQITPPCALNPQGGATGAIDGALIAIDVGRGDWAMCGAPCNCACDGFPLIDFGDCPGTDPRVGWAATSGTDSALVGVGPAYLAEVEYTISADATGSFDFEFVDPKTPHGGEGSVLRDPDSEPILANWIGTKVVIVECTADDQCDDGDDCTVDTCNSENVCVNQLQVLVHLEGPAQALDGSTVTYEIFLSADPCEFDLRGYQMSMPCSASGGTSGHVDYVPPPVIDESHPDYVFAPCGCDTFPVVDEGSCPAPPGSDPRLLNATLSADAVTVGLPPQYLGEFSYEVSAGASGTFTIDLVPDPMSLLRDEEGNDVPFAALGTTLTIVECLADGDCDDGDDCTIDTCDAEKVCVHEVQPQVYGDICEPFDPPDGPQPDLDDILCILDDFADGSDVDGCECNGFRKTTDLNPCPEDGGGDGVLNVDDLLKMLDAFSGLHPCDDPCAE